MIHIIAAIQRKDLGLGFKNELLFRIPEDHKRFKTLTSGHPVIMGRKTFQSIGRPLPNRTNIVITREKSFTEEGIVITHSLNEALTKAREFDKEIFIIGGAEIYKEALPFADTLDLTVIEGDVEADTFFPEYENIFTKVVFEDKHQFEGINYIFQTLTK